ncbi:MAG: hypothetical protein KF855_03805 [Acidobacteria bacterium]|nr:hypothetical protein [Acidobacteriota bacterium]
MSEENTADTQGADTQTAENKSPEDNKDTQPTKAEETKADQPKTFTQEEVNRMLAKERRDFEKRAKDAEEKAKLSEDQRLKAELDDAKKQLAERDRRDHVQAEAQKAGVNNPNLFYKAIKEDLEIDEKTGKITNLAELIESAKSDLPQLFTTETKKTAAGSADGGSGKDGKPTRTKADIDKMTTAEIIEDWDAVEQFLSSQK